jgi:hypothetical protein
VNEGIWSRIKLESIERRVYQKYGQQGNRGGIEQWGKIYDEQTSEPKVISSKYGPKDVENKTNQ